MIKVTILKIEEGIHLIPNPEERCPYFMSIEDGKLILITEEVESEDTV